MAGLECGQIVFCISYLAFITNSANSQPSSTCNPACASGKKCVLGNCVLDIVCPAGMKFGHGPPSMCLPPMDPLNKPPSHLESWLTKDIFYDLFPKSNLGWGPSPCSPYSYEAFVIAARYFPNFAVESPNNSYTSDQNAKRDVSAFFAHAIQETGENDISLYYSLPVDRADACFYRGGFYNWFEGGPSSIFLPPNTPGYSPQDGNLCTDAGRYCTSSAIYNSVYPCNQAQNGSYHEGCYFGRGAVQISYSYNYGALQQWLKVQGLNIDLLTNPNLVMTSTTPPLAFIASLWFYMTPQPPKPAMHDIIIGQWEAGEENSDEEYMGPILGPTSLIINNECNGEDEETPGGPGENRRIKAFKWFCSYFNVPTGSEDTLTCKNMVQKFDQMSSLYNISWQPDWTTTWKEQPCDCAPALYGGMVPYYQPNYYPKKFVDLNEQNRKVCVTAMYTSPTLYSLNPNTTACLKYLPS